MDLIVKRAAEDQTVWTLTDLLGRAFGRITGAGCRFVIEPEERVRPSLTGLNWGPYASLDDALTALEKRTHSSCHRAPEEEEEQP